MSLTHDLPHFKLSEFKHPELVDAEAAQFLERIRSAYAHSLVLTSDARTRAENQTLPGHSDTSLHLLGRAFDLRWSFDQGKGTLWQFVQAVFTAASATDKGIELEIVNSSTDQHVHIGLFPDSRPHRLLVRAE